MKTRYTINRPDSMFLAGLTGGIGSGKSTVARIWNDLGIPVIQLDPIAKELYKEKGEVYQGIIGLLGNGILDTQGNIDTKKMARVIFENPQLLQKVNNIVHPAVFHRVEEILENLYTTKHRDVCAIETAILFETGIDKDLDCIVAVLAPVDNRVKWLVKDRGMDKEDVLKRIVRQSDIEFFEQKSDIIIWNIKDLKALEKEAIAVGQRLIKRKCNG